MTVRIHDFNFRSIEHFRHVYADDLSGNIVFPALIHAGYLGGLTTDESASALFVGLGKAFEKLAEHNGAEFLTPI
jgi:hypothetical protein